jgi:hypothetical protein
LTVGEAGLTVMRYTGLTDIDTYTGKATGQGYIFGLFRMRGLVDTRDVKSLLEIEEDGLKVFEEG